jgi:aldose 1-epimerase
VRLSGKQVEITHGTQRATVTSVGATLRAYAIDDRAVLDGFDADEVCPGGRGQVLMPWPNRVAGGQYTFEGRHHQLPINEPQLGHALHGLVRWAEWHIEYRSAEAVRLRHRLCASPGYPFQLDLEVEYRLSASGLGVTFDARNAGHAPCPFGAGAHPYFAFAGARVDTIELCVGAQDYLEVDARSIPLGSRPVDGSEVDFRRPRAIGTARLDHAFTRLERDAAGVACALLRHEAGEIRLWLDSSFEFVQVYTGDTLPDRTRQSVALEPMSCAPDAFNNGQGLLVLGPGESMRSRWGLVAA